MPYFYRETSLHAASDNSRHERSDFDHVTCTSHVCILCKRNMADSSSSESSSTSGSDYSDFEAAVEEEINETVEPFSEIKPWRFEPPGRTTENRDLEEDTEPIRPRRRDQESDEW